jgi:hypothetical protein
MMLELREAEVQELQSTLERRLEQLLDEIIHTDDREYRSELRHRYEQLDSMRHRLESLTESAQTYA